MMKKLSILLAIFMLLSLMGCGQTPKQPEDSETELPSNSTPRTSYTYPEYSEEFSRNMTAKVSDLSDSILSYAPIEYQKNTNEAYPETPEDLTASLSLFGTTYTGTYRKTFYTSYNYYPCYEYETADSSLRFKYDPDGNLTAFSRKGMRYDNDEKCDESLILQNAEEFMRQFVDTSLYEVNITYYDQYAQYFVEYVKYISDIPTGDRAELTFTPAGELAFYSASLLGKIAVQSKSPIDVEEALYTVHQRLLTIYESIKEKCDYLFYEEPSYVLTMLSDGSLAMMVEAGVEACTDTGYGEIDIRGSEIRFIVQ